MNNKKMKEKKKKEMGKNPVLNFPSGKNLAERGGGRGLSLTQ
jgi:hypothetical protein